MTSTPTALEVIDGVDLTGKVCVLTGASGGLGAESARALATTGAHVILADGFETPFDGKNGRVGPPVHEDLVGRNFTADALDQLWLADITEHHTGQGKLYLCAIKDVEGS